MIICNDRKSWSKTYSKNHSYSDATLYTHVHTRPLDPPVIAAYFSRKPYNSTDHITTMIQQCSRVFMLSFLFLGKLNYIYFCKLCNNKPFSTAHNMLINSNKNITIGH